MADMTAEQLRAELVKLWREMADFRCAGWEMTADAVHMYMRDYAEQLREIASRISGMAAVPDGWKLVPVDPTPEIIAAAAIAVWPTASIDDIAVARKAAMLVLQSAMDLAPGATLEQIAAVLATMPPAYRAMLAAAPEVPGHV